MFSSYKHKIKQSYCPQEAKQDKIAENIVYKCLDVQDKAATFLQEKSEKLPAKAKRSVVIAFCFTSFCSCLYVILKSFNTRPDISLANSTPEVPTQKVLKSTQASISKGEFEKIEEFKNHLDGSVKSKSDRRIADSIIINRPGLIDSISILENLYHLQSSHK